MPKWPVITDDQMVAQVGVDILRLVVQKQLQWVFRETPTCDLGIDGEIEVRRPDDTSHGRIIAVQVKSGSSYLREQTDRGFVFRSDPRHLRYWTSHTSPVIVVLCDPITQKCWWQSIDMQEVRFHESGWSIEVPFANVIGSESADALEAVANRLQKKDLLDLLLRDWLVRSFEYQIRIASILVSPRDYHYLSVLAQSNGRFIMADYVLSDLTNFSLGEIQEMTRWAAYNHEQFGFDHFILAFVSENLAALEKIPPPIAIEGVLVEYAPLLLDIRGEPSLREVGANGTLIEEYENGKVFGPFMEDVVSRRQRVNA